jgi:hypothetical protein
MTEQFDPVYPQMRAQRFQIVDLCRGVQHRVPV